MIHPHDDEPDPTVHMGNYNFPQMLFSFLSGFATMFVLAVDTVNDFKGCPLPEYFQKRLKDESRFNRTRKDGRRYVPSYDEGGY